VTAIIVDGLREGSYKRKKIKELKRMNLITGKD
jgi:hypothetical protein